MTTATNKKQLQAIILHGTAEDIFKAYKADNGMSVNLSKDWGRLTSWVRDAASSERAYNKAIDLLVSECMMKHQDRELARMKRGGDHFERMHVLEYLRTHLTDIRRGDRYAKVPTMGHTHLYMCSPAYGHGDYNKWQALPLAGNRDFCTKLVALAGELTKTN